MYVNGLLSADVLDRLRAHDVAGIEYYHAGAAAPIAYEGAGRNCAVVLVWLKW